MRVVAEEQFGPVLPVMAYGDVEDALARANDTHFGLNGSVCGVERGSGTGRGARYPAGMR
ncbi:MULTISPECIES: aldehyde dehydrogenase family protein [Streptomyces]|uniref:aldehyde dehydrogenase family protein n=1 Tax=Streptomyces TaxID=1883 RepID=UPI002E7FD5C4|nr:aldehyde dehydrogenase family protein [Streptomyces griseorubiginosus]WUB42651.1 aldehyde dehydrogenase family protein [Streptomyces griseorubiginosus]WUB51170.1 aldehyde dehydrogenase family protein [Streptomyces griseorubiginosus]